MQVQHAIQAFGAWLLQDQRLQLSEAPHSSQEDAQEDPAEPALAQKPAQLRKVANMAQSGQFAGLVELQQAVQSALEAAHAEAVQSLKHKGPTFRSALTGFSDRCQGFACASDMARKLCGGLLGSLSSSCPQRLKAWSQRCDAACLAHKIPALSLVTLPPRTCNMVYPVPCSHVHHLHSGLYFWGENRGISTHTAANGAHVQALGKAGSSERAARLHCRVASLNPAQAAATVP